MHSSKWFLLTLALSSPLFAQDIKIVGTLDKTLITPQSQPLKLTHRTHRLSAPRVIKLLKVELSKPAEAALNKRASLIATQSASLNKSSHYPGKIDLGMNDVPVQDQGDYGTCVTFAVTSAIDAALGQGDYISQLCSLQLGNYLQTNGYTYSGWDGSLGSTVLSQIETFGIINKEQEHTIGCGGLTHYPAHTPIPEGTMNPEDYHQLSENINDVIAWSPILDIYTAMDRVDTNATLDNVKKALNENDRVTFGVLLLDFDLGVMGAVGTHNSHYDSWVLTPEIARDIYLKPQFGGHEMIITGYDDNAIATDEQGHEHKGLLTLRNSWGDKIGDHGNFYMSYDYFKVLTIEAQRIRSMQADGGVDSQRA